MSYHSFCCRFLYFFLLNWHEESLSARVCVRDPFLSAWPGVVVSAARTFITFAIPSHTHTPKKQVRFAVPYRCMQSGSHFLLRKCNVPHANWLLWLAPIPSHSVSLFGTAIAFNVNFFRAPLAKKIWKIFVIELFEMYNKHSSGFADCRGYSKRVAYTRRGPQRMGAAVNVEPELRRGSG